MLAFDFNLLDSRKQFSVVMNTFIGFLVSEFVYLHQFLEFFHVETLFVVSNAYESAEQKNPTNFKAYHI